MKNSVKTILICAMCIALASCANSPDNTAGENTDNAAAETTVSENNTAVSGSPEETGTGNTDAVPASVSADVSESASEPAAASDMFTNRDYEIGFSDAAEVKFASEGGSVNGSGAVAENNIVRITEAGTYRITGTITDGQIIVDAADDAKIQIVLDNASVTCAGSAALYIKNADKVFVTTAEGSNNTLSSVGEFTADGDINVDGTVFAKSDVTFNGSGTLNITSDTKHGIVCKDDLKFTSGTYSISSASKGIDCKESVRIAGGTIDITSGTDGIHAENTDKPEKGFVYVCGGNITVNSGNDAVDATGDITVTDGTFDITSDGGAANAPAHRNNDFGGGFRWDRDNQGTDSSTTSESSKGIKSDAAIMISGGKLNIDSSDDAVHSATTFTMTGGDLAASSGDDGLHADNTVLISDGTVNITNSYEGIEGEIIEISGGKVSVTASDDGMNAAGGTVTNGGWGMMDTDSNAKLTISGGEIYVNASGDGLDSNGYLYVTGGRTFVSGPTNSGNGALDSGLGATITGGYIIAAGATGMAENFGSESTQGSILYTFDSTVTGGTEISISDSDGNVILSFTPEKNYQCAVISAPEIQSGSTYKISANGSDYTVEMTSNIYGASSGFGGGMGGFGGGRIGNGEKRNFANNNDTSEASGTTNEQRRSDIGSENESSSVGNAPEANADTPQMPDSSEIPQMPDNGEMPQLPGNGEMPQLPGNGEMPQMPENGEMPQMQGGKNFGGRGGFDHRNGQGQPSQTTINNSDTSPT